MRLLLPSLLCTGLFSLSYHCSGEQQASTSHKRQDVKRRSEWVNQDLARPKRQWYNFNTGQRPNDVVNLVSFIAEQTPQPTHEEDNSDYEEDATYTYAPNILGEESIIAEDDLTENEDDYRYSSFENEDEFFSADRIDLDGFETLSTPSVPLAYRYYRRSVYRQRTSLSIPFILLGPNVDHWKQTGQELASAGFSTIACERVHDDNTRRGKDIDLKELSVSDSAKAITDLMDALRWSRAVLVACDSESVMAIQVALHLAPHRLVGLVLCGNMEAAQNFVERMQPESKNTLSSFAVDRFLRQFVECPSAIVWDGDKSFRDDYSVAAMTPQEAASIESLANSRIVVRGSGTVPHRRQPEYLSWVLTRFVEQHVAPLSPQSIKRISDKNDFKVKRNQNQSVDMHGSKNFNFFRRDVSAFFFQKRA